MKLCSIAYYKSEHNLIFIPKVYVVRQLELPDGQYALYYIKENAIRPDEALMLTLTPAQKETLVLIGAEDEETNNI